MNLKKFIILVTASLLFASCNNANYIETSGPAQNPPVVTNGVMTLSGSLLVTDILDESRYNYIQAKNVSGVHTIIVGSKFQSLQNTFIFIDPDLKANCTNGVSVPTTFTMTDSSGNTLEVPMKQKFTVIPQSEYTLSSKTDLTNCTGSFVFWFGLRAGK